MASFGQTVWYKAKAYRIVKEKEMDVVANKDLPVRWKRAFYRVPSMEVTDRGPIALARGRRAHIFEGAHGGCQGT